MAKKLTEKQIIKIHNEIDKIYVEIEQALSYPNINYSNKGNALYDLIKKANESIKKLPIQEIEEII